MSQLPTRFEESGVAERRRPPALPPEAWLSNAGEPPLRHYWRTIQRRRWLIAGVFAAIVLGVTATVLPSPDIYTAGATLLIEPEAPRILEIPEVLSQSLGADSYYETQYEILRSRALAAAVLESHPPTPAGPDEPPSLLQRWRDRISGWLGPDEPLTDEERLAARIAGYQRALEIEPSRDTRLVYVRFSAEDRNYAARMANAHAEAYIAQGLGMRSQASREAKAFLLEQAVELRERVNEAQAKLASYSSEHGIVSLQDRGSVEIERLAELSTELTQAESERIARETERRLLRERGPDSLPGVLQSPLVNTLKQDLARLEGEYASLASRYRPGFPDLVERKAQLDDARRRLDAEIQHIAGGVEAAYLAARDRESSLRARLASQKGTALRIKDASVEYAMLENELLISQKLYDEVRQRIKQTDVAGELRESNVFLLERAVPPVRPGGPSKAVLLAMGLVLALVGSIGIALIAEQLDGRVRTSEELERHLGLPALGSVPNLSRRGAAARVMSVRRLALRAGPEAEGVGDPAAHPPLLPAGAPPQTIEAYRRIRTNILLSQAEQPPRTILFTSAGPGEGKTTTVLNTARLFAQLGGPVLVIDADLRKPECHRMLGLPNGLGLTEILTGGALGSDSLHRIEGGLSLLVSGKRPPNPTELVGSDLMRELLESACARFDYVLIDSPPLGAVSDSVLLARLVDGVVMVADQQRTQRAKLTAAHERLVYARAKVLGTVLNRADEKAEVYPLEWEPVRG